MAKMTYIPGYLDIDDTDVKKLISLQERGLVEGFDPRSNDIGYDSFYISEAIPFYFEHGYPSIPGSFWLL